MLHSAPEPAHKPTFCVLFRFSREFHSKVLRGLVPRTLVRKQLPRSPENSDGFEPDRVLLVHSH
jgi:hypothetical protein